MPDNSRYHRQWLVEYHPERLPAFDRWQRRRRLAYAVFYTALAVLAWWVPDHGDAWVVYGFPVFYGALAVAAIAYCIWPDEAPDAK